MAYEMDEENGWGAEVVRGFCYEGEAYVPGQWFYGPQEVYFTLMRMGVFGQSIPRWLLEHRIAQGPSFGAYWGPNSLTPGSDGLVWEHFFAKQYHVFN